MNVTNVSADPDQGYSRTFNSFRHVISVTDEGGTITYNYYSSGLPKSIVAPGNLVTSMQYDLYGNQTQLTEPNSGTYNYEYNAFGELVMQADNGDTITVSYDDLGRPVSITEEEGTTTYTYDTKINGKGMVASIAGPGGVSKEYSYDEYSRIASVTETIDGRDFTETLDYDDYGRLSKLTYPSGFGVTYNYNNYHYLSEVNRTDNQSMIWKAE